MTHTPSPAPGSIRVVVADDSAFMRRVLCDALRSQGFAVVAEASNGDEALDACAVHKPDVLSLDLAMPGLDGLGVLQGLRRRRSPVAVVVVSAFSPAHGARAVDALAEGAVELVAKPAAGPAADSFLAELSEKVLTAAGSRRGRTTPVRPPARPAAAAPAVRSATKRAVVIACSTGGPRALAQLMPMLPGSLGSGTVIVQHMPPGFTGSLAARLDSSCALTVREARRGDTLEAYTALLAPGGQHLRLSPAGGLSLSDDAEVGGLRPRADLTIIDAARAFPGRLLLVVLTGMGRDGLEGAQAARRAGARVIVEAESTCTVYGMPRAVADAGLADAILPLPELAAAIVSEAG